jgi:Ala-tRNA(Pro) deacylase
VSVTVFQRIIKLLSDNKISYKLIEHEPIFTSEQAAKVRGTDLKSGAKALVFIADKEPIMIVVPGDKRVDLRKFKDTFKIKNLAMASSEEVEDFIEGVKVGAVHPFGNLHGLPVYVDQSLGRNKEIVFNAGLHEKSIKMSYQDYYRLVKPRLGNFAF